MNNNSGRGGDEGGDDGASMAIGTRCTPETLKTEKSRCLDKDSGSFSSRYSAAASADAAVGITMVL